MKHNGAAQRRSIVHKTGVCRASVADFMCEAIPGATAQEMIGEGSAIDDDYEGYLEKLGEAPDIVTIEFGLNESDASLYRDSVQRLIDMITHYDDTHDHRTLIYVMIPFTRNLSGNSSAEYNLGITQIREGQKCTLEAWSLTNCILIPTHQIFDDRYDYSMGTLDYGYGVTVEVVEDIVHPSEAVGFRKLADTVWTYLGVER